MKTFSPYTLAKNCTDLSDLEVGISEIKEYFDKCYIQNKKPRKTAYNRLAALESKKEQMTCAVLGVRKMFMIIVDNSTARSFNSNIDTPEFTCFAYNKEEAVGKMMLSDFAYKHKPVLKITELS